MARKRVIYLHACAFCSKEFQGRKDSKYCSRSCQAIHLRKIGLIPDRKRMGVTKTCEACGKEYYVPQYRSEITKYCSRSCLAKIHLPQFVHFNPILFRKGATKRHYKIIITPDGRRMRVHRWLMEQKVGRKLLPHEHVHHVNGDWNDNRPENLVLLTNAEHQRLELNETVSALKAQLRRD